MVSRHAFRFLQTVFPLFWLFKVDLRWGERDIELRVCRDPASTDDAPEGLWGRWGQPQVDILHVVGTDGK